MTDIASPSNSADTLVPCPFCSNVPVFSDVESKDENRYKEMRLECCITMRAALPWSGFKAMSDTDIDTHLRAELARKWNGRLFNPVSDTSDREVTSLSEAAGVKRSTPDHEGLDSSNGPVLDRAISPEAVAEAAIAASKQEAILAPARPTVVLATDPWEQKGYQTEVKSELLGRWTVIPLTFGDGTVIMTENKRHAIIQFSDYATAQQLTVLHNKSIDVASTSNESSLSKLIKGLEFKRDMGGAVEFRKAVDRLVNAVLSTPAQQSDRHIDEIVAVLRETADESRLEFSAKEMRAALNLASSEAAISAKYKARAERSEAQATHAQSDIGEMIRRVLEALDRAVQETPALNEELATVRAALTLALQIKEGQTKH